MVYWESILNISQDGRLEEIDMKGIYFYINKLYSYDSFVFLRNKIDGIYNNWIRHEFAFVGKNVYIGKLSQLVGAKNITLFNGVSIGKGTYLCAWEAYGKQSFTPKIIFNENVIVGPNAHITSCNCIEIGSGTLLGKWVTITDNSHGEDYENEVSLTPIKRPLYSKGSVVIGKNVWIGDKVTILPNVKIGDGSVIGANSVVTKDVPSYCVAAGNPAKVIKQIKL